MHGRTLTFSAATALLAVAGCSSGGSGSGYRAKTSERLQPVTVAPGQESQLLPAKVGATWTYDADAAQSGPQGPQSSKGEVTFRVKAVDETADGQEIEIDVSSGGKL